MWSRKGPDAKKNRSERGLLAAAAGAQAGGGRASVPRKIGRAARIRRRNNAAGSQPPPPSLPSLQSLQSPPQQSPPPSTGLQYLLTLPPATADAVPLGVAGTRRPMFAVTRLDTISEEGTPRPPADVDADTADDAAAGISYPSAELGDLNTAEIFGDVAGGGGAETGVWSELSTSPSRSARATAGSITDTDGSYRYLPTERPPPEVKLERLSVDLMTESPGTQTNSADSAARFVNVAELAARSPPTSISPRTKQPMPSRTFSADNFLLDDPVIRGFLTGEPDGGNFAVVGGGVGGSASISFDVPTRDGCVEERTTFEDSQQSVREVKVWVQDQTRRDCSFTSRSPAARVKYAGGDSDGTAATGVLECLRQTTPARAIAASDVGSCGLRCEESKASTTRRQSGPVASTVVQVRDRPASLACTAGSSRSPYLSLNSPNDGASAQPWSSGTTKTTATKPTMSSTASDGVARAVELSFMLDVTRGNNCDVGICTSSSNTDSNWQLRTQSPAIEWESAGAKVGEGWSASESVDVVVGGTGISSSTDDGSSAQTVAAATAAAAEAAEAALRAVIAAAAGRGGSQGGGGNGGQNAQQKADSDRAKKEEEMRRQQRQQELEQLEQQQRLEQQRLEQQRLEQQQQEQQEQSDGKPAPDGNEKIDTDADAAAGASSYYQRCLDRLLNADCTRRMLAADRVPQCDCGSKLCCSTVRRTGHICPDHLIDYRVRFRQLMRLLLTEQQCGECSCCCCSSTVSGGCSSCCCGCGVGSGGCVGPVRCCQRQGQCCQGQLAVQSGGRGCNSCCCNSSTRRCCCSCGGGGGSGGGGGCCCRVPQQPVVCCRRPLLPPPACCSLGRSATAATLSRICGGGLGSASRLAGSNVGSGINGGGQSAAGQLQSRNCSMGFKPSWAKSTWNRSGGGGGANGVGAVGQTAASWYSADRCPGTTAPAIAGKQLPPRQLPLRASSRERVSIGNRCVASS